MTSWEPGDEVEEALRALRAHDAGRERAERIRSACVAVLGARQKAESPAKAPRTGWRAWLEPAFAMGLGALYLAEAVSRALMTRLEDVCLLASFPAVAETVLQSFETLTGLCRLDLNPRPGN